MPCFHREMQIWLGDFVIVKNKIFPSIFLYEKSLWDKHTPKKWNVTLVRRVDSFNFHEILEIKKRDRWNKIFNLNNETKSKSRGKNSQRVREKGYIGEYGKEVSENRY